jgi:hypothetical protein
MLGTAQQHGDGSLCSRNEVGAALVRCCQEEEGEGGAYRHFIHNGSEQKVRSPFLQTIRHLKPCNQKDKERRRGEQVEP